MAGSVPTYNLYGEENAVEREFWVHCETIAARSSGYRWEIGLHRHESFLQFLYIRSGSGDALLPSGIVPLSPPCVVVVPPGPEHGFRFSPDIDGLVVTLVPERLRLARDLPGEPPWFRLPVVLELGATGDASYLDATFQRIAGEYEGQPVGWDDCVEAHVATVILLLARLLMPEPQDAPADLNRQRVQQLMRLIADHHREQLTVEDYAARLKLSPTHLNRIVRQVTGVSTHDLIIGKSIEEAKRALVFTASSVQAVAESLGFSDPAYFSRCFRHRTGMTPKAYREAERSKLRNKDTEPSVKGEILKRRRQAMAEHLGEAASNGELNVGGGHSSVGYKVTARKQDGGKVQVAISVMAPRDWLLKQGFKKDATLVRANGGEVSVSHEGGELDVSDSISVTLSAAEIECGSEEEARKAFPELSSKPSH